MIVFLPFLFSPASPEGLSTGAWNITVNARNGIVPQIRTEHLYVNAHLTLQKGTHSASCGKSCAVPSQRL